MILLALYLHTKKKYNVSTEYSAVYLFIFFNVYILLILQVNVHEIDDSLYIMNGKFSGECTFFCIYLFIIRGKKYPHPTTCFTQFTITHNLYLHLSYYFIVLLQTYRFVLVFDMLRRYHIKLK